MTLLIISIWLFVRSALSFKASRYSPQLDAGVQGSYPVKHFISSRLTEPKVNFLTWYPSCEDELYIFLTPKGWKVSEPGPMILDDTGSLVWSKHFDNEYGGQAYGLKVQQYRGTDHLTFWLGDDTVRGHGAGQYYILNSSYDVVQKVGAAAGRYADLHDFTITPEGTALMTIFEPLSADVRPLGRQFNDVWNQAIWDCLLQEVDLETGKLLFEWRASEHVDLNDSYIRVDDTWSNMGTRDAPFDWFHLNSVQKDGNGNYLISARNTHAIYYVDDKTKSIIWTLGGKRNDFEDLSEGHALNFAWQHDARIVSSHASDQGTTTAILTMFDNAAVDRNYAYGPSYSRALSLELKYPTLNPQVRHKQRSDNNARFDIESRKQEPNVQALSKMDQEKVGNINGSNTLYTVRVVQQYINPKNILSSTQGSAQVLGPALGEESKMFVGYGLNAAMTEFASNGTVLCDMHFGAASSWETGDVQSYRAHKYAWIGRPSVPPNAAIRGDDVYVCWNGATECRQWLLQSWNSAKSDWEEVTLAAKQGFETKIILDAQHRHVSRRRLRVVALDKDSNRLEHGASNIIDRGYVTMTVRQHLGVTNTVASAVILFVSFAASVSLWHIYRRLRRSPFRKRTIRHMPSLQVLEHNDRMS